MSDRGVEGAVPGDGPGDAGASPDVTVVVAMFDAINAGDPEAALLQVHPKVVWSPSSWSGAATLRGRDAVRGWFCQFGPNLENLEIEVDEILEGGWIVVLGTIHDTRDDTPFVIRVGWNFGVSGGMIRDGRSFPTWDDARRAGGIDG